MTSDNARALVCSYKNKIWQVMVIWSISVIRVVSRCNLGSNRCCSNIGSRCLSNNCRCRSNNSRCSNNKRCNSSKRCSSTQRYKSNRSTSTTKGVCSGISFAQNWGNYKSKSLLRIFDINHLLIFFRLYLSRILLVSRRCKCILWWYMCKLWSSKWRSIC